MFTLVQTTTWVLATGGLFTSFLSIGLVVALSLLLLERIGLLALVVAVFAASLMLVFPVTLNTESWYFPATLTAGAIVFGLAGFGLWSACAGRSTAIPVLANRV